MKPSGAHTHPDSGGPGLGLAVIVVLVLLVAGSAGAAIHTAEHALDVLVHIVLVVLAVAAGLSLAGLGTAVLMRRHYEKDAASWRATVEPPAARPLPVRSQPQRELPAPQIHLHLHGPVTAGDLARITAAAQPWQAQADDPDYSHVITRGEASTRPSSSEGRALDE